jgi:hypothetical protein
MIFLVNCRSGSLSLGCSHARLPWGALLTIVDGKIIHDAGVVKVGVN